MFTGIPLVLFSGGFDSTALLEDLLKSHKEVDVICCSYPDTDKKSQRELKAREKIFIRLQELHENNPEKFGKVRRLIETDALVYRGDKIYAGHQIVNWLPQAYSCLKIDNDSVYMGIVKGDWIAPRFNLLQESWDLLIKASSTDVPRPYIPKLLAPWINRLKPSIAMAMDPKLLSYVSWCGDENVENDCGKCASCHAMIWDFLPDNGTIIDKVPSLSIFGRLHRMKAIRQQHLHSLIMEDEDEIH